MIVTLRGKTVSDDDIGAVVSAFGGKPVVKLEFATHSGTYTYDAYQEMVAERGCCVYKGLVQVVLKWGKLQSNK